MRSNPVKAMIDMIVDFRDGYPVYFWIIAIFGTVSVCCICSLIFVPWGLSWFPSDPTPTLTPIPANVQQVQPTPTTSFTNQGGGFATAIPTSPVPFTFTTPVQPTAIVQPFFSTQMPIQETTRPAYTNCALSSTYIVQEGQTLGSIAWEVCGDFFMYDDIAAWNGIVDPNYVQMGQRLQLC